MLTADICIYTAHERRTMTRFSVLIPVYNVEKYLKQCLDSVLNQTFKDFEVIAINDGSTDNSLEILEHYAKSDKRFKVYSQENLGLGAVRRNLLNKAAGDYIVFVDADDWLEIDALECIKNKIEETNAVIIQFDYKDYNEKTGRSCVKSLAKDVAKEGVNLYKKPFFKWQELNKGLLFYVSPNVWAKAFSRDFIEKNNINFPVCGYYEDSIFALETSVLAPKIHYINKPLYNYRIVASSISNKFYDEKIDLCVDNINRIKDFLSAQNLLQGNVLKEFNEYIIASMSTVYPFIATDNGYEKFFRICKDILPSKYFKKLQARIKYGNLSFWEKIFSVRNIRTKHAQRKKVLIIFGIIIELKSYN